MVELLPCPFCGGTKCEVVEHPESVWDFVVTCDDCGTSGPIAGWGYPSAWETKEIAHAKAIELWNRRAPVSVTVGSTRYTLTQDGITAESPAPLLF